jgi:hypothetical protein
MSAIPILLTTRFLLLSQGSALPGRQAESVPNSSEAAQYMPEETFLDNFGPLDFVNLAVSAIPSTFVKLAFLASLKDGNDDRYRDPLAGLVYGEQKIEAALQGKHREIFSGWLGLGLAEQMAEVAEYLAAQDEDPNALISIWLHDKVYESLIPSAVSGAERNLFTSDLKAILQLLQVRLGPAGENRDD